MSGRFLIALVVVFLLVSGCAYALSEWNPRFDFKVLMLGNIILFAISMGAYMIAAKSVAERPHRFVRGVFSGTLLRLFVCMAGILVYALMNKTHLYKPMVFSLFGIYVVYTIVETWIMSRTAKGLK